MTALLPHHPYQDPTKRMSWPHIMTGLQPLCDLITEIQPILRSNGPRSWLHCSPTNHIKTWQDPCHDLISWPDCTHHVNSRKKPIQYYDPMTPILMTERPSKAHVMTTWHPWHVLITRLDCTHHDTSRDLMRQIKAILWRYGPHITTAPHSYHDPTGLISRSQCIYIMTALHS